MRLGRLFLIVVLVSWLTGVASYWWTFVPPTPSHVIPLEGRSHRWTPGLGNVIVLSHSGEGEARQSGPRGERRPPSFGPLQFYDPATGQLLREALTADDEILALTLAHREIAICHKDGVITAVDLRNPDKAVELKGVNPNSQFSFGPGAKIVIAHVGRGVAYDSATGARLPDGVQYSGRPMGAIAVSDDGERYVRSDVVHVFVIETSTEKEICRIRLPNAGHYPALVKFSPDGKELMILEDAVAPTRTLTIWDSETGEPLPKQPIPSIPRGPVSRHGSWVITNENAKSLVSLLVEKLPVKTTARLQRSKYFWNLMMRADVAKSHVIILTDSFTGHTLGRYQVPSTAEWMLVAEDERGTVAFGDHDEIRCYDVPANRNWLWLLRWGAGPVAVAWVMQLLFGRWRRLRHEKSPGVATPGLGNGDQTSQIRLPSS